MQQQAGLRSRGGPPTSAWEQPSPYSAPNPHFEQLPPEPANDLFGSGPSPRSSPGTRTKNPQVGGGGVLKYVLLVVVLVVVVLGGVYYATAGVSGTVENPEHILQETAENHEGPAEPAVDTEEGPAIPGVLSKGGYQLHDNDNDLRLRTNEFYTQDRGKKMFLDVDDVGEALVNELDLNSDRAVSFLEYTAGFSGESKKLDIFEELYGAVRMPTVYAPAAQREQQQQQQQEPAQEQHHEMPTAPTEPAHHEEHQEYDDHEIMTEEELNAALDRDFFRMDADGDHHIDLGEYQKWDSENPDYASDFAILDRNSDGRLSRKELSGIEEEEDRAGAGAKEVGDDSDDEDYYSEDESDDIQIHNKHGAEFDKVDVNENGTIELVEFEGLFEDGTNDNGYRFDDLDANGDGTLDLHEFSKPKA